MLPKPERLLGGTSSVRARALARLKVLAAVSAAGVAASCSGKTENSSSGGTSGDPLFDAGGKDAPGQDGYCVVDPLPNPSCFQYTTPTATASYITEDDLDGGTAGGDGGIVDAGGGARLVEVLLGFKQTGVVLGSLTSPDGVTLSEGATISTGARIVLKVPPGLVNATARLQVSCAQGPTAPNLTLGFAPTTVNVSVSEY